MALIDGLQSYYKADGDALDAHGSDNGTYVPGTYVTGIIGNGFSLDGINDSVTGVHMLADATSFTVSAWINGDSYASASGIYKTSGAGNSPIELVWFSVQSEKLYLQMRGNSGALVTAGGVTTLTAGTWYHVVATYDSSDESIEIFVDTVTAGTNTYTGISWSNVDEAAIGEITGSSPFEFDGVIDEVGIWNRVLSGAEITELYNSGAGVAYPFSTPTTSSKLKRFNGTAFVEVPQTAFKVNL